MRRPEALLLWVAIASLLLASSHASREGGVVVTIPRGAAHMPYHANYWPSQIKVVIGVNNTVRWVNMDDHAHTVTHVGGAFNSGLLNMYDSYTYTFTSPGVYQYVCLPHPWMVGYVYVSG